MSAVPKFIGLSGQMLSIAITSILTFGFVLVGYDQGTEFFNSDLLNPLLIYDYCLGVMSGVITSTGFLDTLPQVDHNANLLGFVVAIYVLGCASGAAFCMLLGDRLGRKKACFLGGLTVMIGVIILTTTYATPGNGGALAQFLIGRYVAGCGNGINMASMPVIQAELTHAGRGTIVCLECGLIGIGTMLAYWINYGVRNGGLSFTWRFPLAFQNALALIYTIGVLFIPESPRWLCKVERVEEATKVMAAINNESTDAEGTRNDIRGILDSIAIEKQAGAKSNFRDMTTGGPSQHRRRLLIGISSQFFQQIGGCNAVIYYVPILFEDSLKQSHDESLLLGGANITIYAAFALVSFWTIEWIGRRKLFLAGSIGQCLSMVITFGCLIPGTPSAAKGAAFGLFLYIAFFGATYLTVPWLWAAEINPLRMRAKGAALANVVNWSTNFLVVMVTPIMVQNIGYGTYIFFAAMNAISIPVV